MEPTHDTTWENSLARLAQRYEYPTTPDIAGRQPAVAARPPAVRGRLAPALLVIALIIAVLFAIPQTRAAVLSFFARIGAIDIFIDETAPTPLPTTAPQATGAPTATIPETVRHSLALYELGEPVALDEARRLADFDLVVPAALGEPDEVYVHRNIDLPAVTLVWHPAGGVPLSLTEIGVAAFAEKMTRDENVKMTIVNGRPAVWLTGPHRLQLLGNWRENSLNIESNVLIWAAGDVTHRLEGDLSEAEMVAIAESLAE